MKVGSGYSENIAETLIDSEPAFGDSWLIYLALAPDSVIEDAVDGEGKID
jgi:hypothetical protein